MQEIEISKIVVKDNIRSDYGDITGLTASIKENGVRNPLEIGPGNILIDGHRRLKAATAAGLKTVPFFKNDKLILKTKSQIISGIFNKKLNPLEQGKAFKKHMQETKLTVEQLSKTINKPKDYIEKRLILVDLPEVIKKALIEKKIQMGHALLLAKMPKTNAVDYFNKIVKAEKGVETAKNDLQWGGLTKPIKQVSFNKDACKNCPYNGSVQSELFETGKVLTGICMNPNCFARKIKEFVTAKRTEFKDVLFKSESEYDTPKGYFEKDCWDAKGKGITPEYIKQCKKTRENFLVVIRNDGAVKEFFRPPVKKVTEKAQIKTQETKKEERIENRLEEFKTAFLISKSKELLDAETIQAKRLNLICLIQNNYRESDNLKAENIAKMGEKDLNKNILRYSKYALSQLNKKDLLIISRDIGVDIKKQFAITENYLELYTKDKLMELIKELKLKEIEVTAKKTEIIKHILKQDLKDKIPKILI